MGKPLALKKLNRLHRRVSSKLLPTYGKYDEQSEFPVSLSRSLLLLPTVSSELESVGSILVSGARGSGKEGRKRWQFLLQVAGLVLNATNM